MLAMVALFIVGACSPSKQQQDLNDSLIRLRVAIEQGTSVQQYHDLLFDARSKFEIARGYLSANVSAKCEDALTTAHDAEDIWHDDLDVSGDLPPESFEELRRLGIVKDRYDLLALNVRRLLLSPDFSADDAEKIASKQRDAANLTKAHMASAFVVLDAKLRAAEASLK
jgi:hypothetical protein